MTNLGVERRGLGGCTWFFPLYTVQCTTAPAALLCTLYTGSFTVYICCSHFISFWCTTFSSSFSKIIITTLNNNINIIIIIFNIIIMVIDASSPLSFSRYICGLLFLSKKCYTHTRFVCCLNNFFLFRLLSCCVVVFLPCCYCFSIGISNNCLSSLLNLLCRCCWCVLFLGCEMLAPNKPSIVLGLQWMQAGPN